MKVGLASFAFRWAFKAGLTLEGFLQQAADFGAEVVQLCENSGVERLGERELRIWATSLAGWVSPSNVAAPVDTGTRWKPASAARRRWDS